MRKPDAWHIVWVLVLVVGVVLLVLTFGIAFYHREKNTFSNFASIWGLFVGLIGFIVTIYTLFETQRMSRNAQQEVQKATIEAQQRIEDAARQTRQVIERVRPA